MDNTKSSYKNSIDYKDIFRTICFFKKQPEKIVEIGILDGYSLKYMVDSVSNECQIEAYDIFDEFNGNGANKDKLNAIFDSYDNVNIQYGDYYKILDNFDDETIDVLHIDIANNGETYEFALNSYINKIKKDGTIILEGGSEERDNIEWMIKYDKPKIRPVLSKYTNQTKMITIGNVPSMTIIAKR